jgi:hypothetical protein
VKSDGLAEIISKLVRLQKNQDIMFFDMSGPEHLKYQRNSLKTLNRVSEFESGFKFPSGDDGIWLDAFFTDDWRILWLKENRTYKKIFIVSPELHGRKYSEFWKELKKIDGQADFYLCTDYPTEAQEFFGSNK